MVLRPVCPPRSGPTRARSRFAAVARCRNAVGPFGASATRRPFRAAGIPPHPPCPVRAGEPSPSFTRLPALRRRRHPPSPSIRLRPRPPVGRPPIRGEAARTAAGCRHGRPSRSPPPPGPDPGRPKFPHVRALKLQTPGGPTAVTAPRAPNNGSTGGQYAAAKIAKHRRNTLARSRPPNHPPAQMHTGPPQLILTSPRA